MSTEIDQNYHSVREELNAALNARGILDRPFIDIAKMIKEPLSIGQMVHFQFTIIDTIIKVRDLTVKIAAGTPIEKDESEDVLKIYPTETLKLLKVGVETLPIASDEGRN